MGTKELIHIELLRDLREVRKELPILEVASIIKEIYEQEELEILAKELLK